MTEKIKILIGYDGSDCAEAALDDLQLAGLPTEAQASVLSVTEIFMPPPPPSGYEIVEQAREVHVPADMKRVYAAGSPAMKNAQSLAERGAARLRANFPQWEVSTEWGCGSPAWELIRKADQWQPDLIVVGSHGRSAVGRLVLGSVSQRVLAEARCSVRIARGRVEEPGTPARIVVGVDGSPASQKAVREVAARLWPLKSEVRVIAVNDPLSLTFVGALIPPLARSVEESNESDRHWLKRVLDDCVQLLIPAEVNVSTQILEGNPKAVLVEAAEKWRADSIFVGSTGFSNRLERFVLGSVSSTIAARAHCTVEVVRKAQTT
jgi:nucleotide-binding universal stress UspA family protein